MENTPASPLIKTHTTGLPITLKNWTAIQILSRNPRLLRDLGFTAIASIPLIVAPAYLGALLIGSKNRRVAPHEERALLEAIGREIGAGILRGMPTRDLKRRTGGEPLPRYPHSNRHPEYRQRLKHLRGSPHRRIDENHQHARKLKDGDQKGHRDHGKTSRLSEKDSRESGWAGHQP